MNARDLFTDGLESRCMTRSRGVKDTLKTGKRHCIKMVLRAGNSLTKEKKLREKILHFSLQPPLGPEKGNVIKSFSELPSLAEEEAKYPIEQGAAGLWNDENRKVL